MKDLRLKEPRTGKSFRAAAERIVRQESAVSSPVTRLLSAPMPARTRRDQDEWDIRLGALAMLGQYDGLLVAVGDPLTILRAYNVPGDPRADTAIRGVVEDVGQRSSVAQIRVSVALADGRTADALLVVPFGEGSDIKGTLIGMRVGRSFAGGDVVIASTIAELLKLDVAQHLSSRREETIRRQALALYELGRLALFGEDSEQTIRSALAMLAETLDHQIAHLWTLRSGGSLELRTAHPANQRLLDVLRPRELGVLSDALYDRRVMRIGSPPGYAWVPRGITTVLVAPVEDRSRPLGVLVLGRTREPYRQDDEDFALAISGFIGRLVAMKVRTQADNDPHPRAAEADSVAEWEDEREPTPT